MLVGLICFIILFYIGCCMALSKKSRAAVISVAIATESLIDWCLDIFFDVPHYVVHGAEYVCERACRYVVWCGVSLWRWITRAKLKEALYDAEGDLYQAEMNVLRWKGMSQDHQGNSESYEKRLRKAEHDLRCYEDKYNPNSIPS